MRRRIRWALLGVLAFVFSLIATLPAERAAEWGAGMARSNGVRIAASGVSGSAWNGSAANATVNGILLGRTAWVLSPWYLPTGDLAMHWRIEPGGGWLEGDARLSPASLRMQAVDGELPASTVVTYLGRAPSFVQVDGKVLVRIDELVRSGGKIETASATLVWRQAALVQPAAVRLGDLKVEFTPGAYGAITGKLSDGGGPLSLSGNLSVNPDGSYRLNATLAARSGADAALVNSLPMIGRPDGKGGYQVVWAGRFSR